MGEFLLVISAAAGRGSRKEGWGGGPARERSGQGARARGAAARARPATARRQNRRRAGKQGCRGSTRPGCGGSPNVRALRLSNWRRVGRLEAATQDVVRALSQEGQGHACGSGGKQRGGTAAGRQASGQRGAARTRARAMWHTRAGAPLLVQRTSSVSARTPPTPWRRLRVPPRLRSTPVRRGQLPVFSHPPPCQRRRQEAFQYGASLTVVDEMVLPRVGQVVACGPGWRRGRAGVVQGWCRRAASKRTCARARARAPAGARRTPFAGRSRPLVLHAGEPSCARPRRTQLVQGAAGLRVVLREDAQEGHHRQAPVLDLLLLQLGIVALGEGQGVKACMFC